MKNNREMLKEAIAEARTVKETAIANAKLALEETITPKLKSMLAKRLEEMEVEEEMEEDEVKEMESKKMEEEMEKEMEEGMSGEMDETCNMDEEIDLDELLAELEEEQEYTLYTTNVEYDNGKTGYMYQLVNSEDREENEIGFDQLYFDDKDNRLEMGVDFKDFDQGSYQEEEVSAEEAMKMYKSLAEGRLLKEDSIDEAEEVDVEDNEKVDVDIEKDVEDEEIDLEEMSEEDLKSFIEDVIKDMVETGELEAGDEFEAEGEEAEGEEEIEVEDETEEIMEGDEEMEEALDLGVTDAEFLASMLGGVALVGGIALDAAKKELMDAAKKGKEAVAATMKSLLGTNEMAEAEEMTNEVESLKNEINEVNLLNAKLLYLNKIFRAKNLTENQKAKIIPAFDKAATVKEAKLIFETISENFSDSKKSIEKNRSLASKPVGVAPKREVIVEVDSQVARWQKLAGIK